MTDLLPLEPSMEADAIAHAVIGAAIEVHRALGPGLLEGMYERALCIELTRRGIEHATQVAMEATYKGEGIGTVRLDLVVELKTVDALLPIHTAETLAYLRITGLKLGLLINFNTLALKSGIKRIVNSH